MSVFSVLVDTPLAIDLKKEPFASPPGRWTHPSDYAATVKLGAETLVVGMAAIRDPSTWPAEGINVALIYPAALVPPSGPHSCLMLLVAATVSSPR